MVISTGNAVPTVKALAECLLLVVAVKNVESELTDAVSDSKCAVYVIAH